MHRLGYMLLSRSLHKHTHSCLTLGLTVSKSLWVVLKTKNDSEDKRMHLNRDMVSFSDFPLLFHSQRAAVYWILILEFITVRQCVYKLIHGLWSLVIMDISCWRHIWKLAYSIVFKVVSNLFIDIKVKVPSGRCLIDFYQISLKSDFFHNFPYFLGNYFNSFTVFHNKL